MGYFVVFPLSDHCFCFLPTPQLADTWSYYHVDTRDKFSLGEEFYKRLFLRYPDLVLLFQGIDTTALSKQVTNILQNVVTGFGDMWSVRAISESVFQILFALVY